MRNSRRRPRNRPKSAAAVLASASVPACDMDLSSSWDSSLIICLIMCFRKGTFRFIFVIMESI